MTGSWWPDWESWVAAYGRRRGAGARARRRQAEADRGCAGQLRQGPAELSRQPAPDPLATIAGNAIAIFA